MGLSKNTNKANYFDYKEKVDNDIINLIKNNISYNGDSILLTCGQLDRKVYERVDEVFSRFGGKWNRKIKSHDFPFNPKPLISEFLKLGLMPPKNPLAFFPTPQKVIDIVMEYIENDVGENSLFLEPSGGQGRIADEIINKFNLSKSSIHICELDKYNKATLKAKKYKIVSDNFLGYNPKKLYNFAIMNPPFSVEGDSRAWITHILHAYELLKEGGVLVSITPRFKHLSTSKMEALYKVMGISDCCTVEDIEDGAFKESGTNIPTSIIYLRKPFVANEEKLHIEPYNGYKNYYSFEFFLYSDNTQELAKKKEEIYNILKGDETISDYSFIKNYINDVKVEARKDNVYLGFDEPDVDIIIDEILGQATEYFG